MSIEHKKNAIYSNCCILHPDGRIMFRCKQTKFDWYASRNLLEIIEPGIGKLKFSPNGAGNAGIEYFLQPKENRCVVCGNIEILTAHHVVPNCYRKHFPETYKIGNNFDILAVCVTCHKKYEKFAQTKKNELGKNWQVPDEGIPSFYRIQKIVSYCRALHRHEDKLPQYAKDSLLNKLKQHLNKDTITESEIEYYANKVNRNPYDIPGYKSHGQLVVEKIDDFQKFCEDWRRHFVQKMKPKFLPNGYNVCFPADINSIKNGMAN